MAEAPWVGPHADKLAANRKDVVAAARAVPESKWSEASSYEGWSLKDQLGHIWSAHRRIHGMLGAVLEGRDPDFAQYLRIDQMNEEERQKDALVPVDEIVSSFAAASEETERLVRQLTAEHEGFKLGPMTLAQALAGFTMHDTSHLDEIRKVAQL